MKYISASLGKVLLVMSVLTCTSQLLKAQSNSIYSGISNIRSNDTSPSTTKLSEVLKSFKFKFDADILFEDKVLDGMMVSSDILNTKETIEVNLNNLLSGLPLSFKKVKEKTYVIISSKKLKKNSSIGGNKIVEANTTHLDTDNTTPNVKSVVANIKIESQNKVFPNEIIVSGKVNDDKGIPLLGVTIVERGKNNTTLSKVDGTFSIKVSSAKSTLVFSYEGFESKSITVGNNTEKLSIALKQGVKDLEQVVVVGYGTQRKKDLTGSIARVNITDMQKAPVRSFEEALGGRVAGVQVTSTDGQPGSAVSIVIRGNSSITQDNSPLYVVDGFPIENPNNNAINPADIESVEILKDASATAIYGARAANGVIMITTKKGSAGKTKFTLSSSYGNQSIINKIPVLNGYEFVRFQSEYDSVNTKSQYFTLGQTLDSFKNSKGIDWQNQVFTSAPISNTSFSMSGGNADTKFFASMSALNQNGIVKFSGYDRYQARLRLDHNISSKAKFAMNINYSALKGYGTIPSSLTGSSSQSSNLMFSVWGYRPIAGTKTVNLLSGVDPFFLLDPNDARFNPLETVQFEVRNRIANNLYGNASYDYEIIKDMKFKAVVGFTNDVERDEAFNGSNTRLGSPKTVAGRNNGVNGSFLYTTTNSYVSENTISINKRLNKQTFDIVTGFTCQGTTRYSFGASAAKLPNERLGLAGLDEGTPNKVPATRSNSTLASFLGRVNYSYDGKYLATVSFRADGSSKFAPENHWSYFPSASIAWRLSQENFMKKLDFINDLKVRTSYGLVGNNRVGDFASANTLTSPIVSSYPFNGAITSSTIPSALGNPNLKWETTAQMDGGIDLTAFHSRINLTLDIYRKVTSDLLLNAKMPPSSGFTTAFKNVGKVQNQGLEISLTAKVIDQGKLIWNSGFNIAFNNNKVLELADGQQTLLTPINWDNQWNGSSPYIAKVGQPLGLMFGYIWDGNYQYSDFDKNSLGAYALKPNVTSNTTVPSTKIQPGYIKYHDLNGDLVMNDDDRTIIGNANPKYTGGFTNNITYGSFDLSIFFQFSYGANILNANRLVFEGNSGRTMQNQFATVLNRWSPTNQNNQMFITKGGGDKVYSSRVVEDGSYIRLKTVQLGYNLPVNMLKKVGISTARFYASAQNIITWTKYTGFDPEVSAYNSALTSGFDYSVYPRAKTVTIGLNVTF